MNLNQFNQKYNPNYDGLFSVIDHIGDDLNARKLRFDKADVIEGTLDKATKGKLNWVDSIGYDHIDENGVKFEVKSQKHCLYTAKGNQKKKTKNIKLTNTLSQDPTRKLKATADYLILIDTGDSNSYSMAIINYKTVIDNYANKLDDGFECQIPSSAITMLITPDNVNIKKPNNLIAYQQQKQQMQKKYINNFFS